jgi:hypothetical protein
VDAAERRPLAPFGDKRQPEAWFAWGVVAPKGRTDDVKVYRS